MDRYLVTLYVHFLAIVAAVAASAILHFNAVRLRRAANVAEARDAVGTIGRVAPLMPLFSLALLASGAYMVQLRWTWSQGWVIASIAGLLSMPVLTLALLKPRLGALAVRLRDANDGAVDAGTSAAIHDRVIGAAMNYNHVIVLAIMFLMVAKLSLGASLAVLAAAPLVSLWSMTRGGT